jgi:hypothetical protein
MLTRGVFHAVTDDDLKQLRRTKDGPKRRDLIEQWDERWPKEWRCDTDKSWKFLVAVLAGKPGPTRSAEFGFGLGSDMFYGQSLHRPNFYVIALVPNEWLIDIVNSLDAIDEERYWVLFHSRGTQSSFSCFSFQVTHGIDTTDDRWRTYSWKWLKKIRSFLRKALKAKRSVVFSAENC